MPVRRFRMANKLPRQASPRAFETIEKEFERVYAMLQGLADQGDAGETAITGLAPDNAEYIVGATNANLTAERVVTDTATITWDLATSGQAKANVPNNAITDAKLRDSAALSVIGRASNSAGDPADIAAASASTVLRRNAANALEFAKADLTVDVQGRLPYANLVAATAASRLLGRTSASAGDWQEITPTSGVGMSGTNLVAAEGGGHYEPLTNGDSAAPEILFVGADVLMIWVP